MIIKFIKNIHRKIQCSHNFHKNTSIYYKFPGGKYILLKCEDCGKYCLFHLGLGISHWTFNIDDFPEYVKKYIEDNNL